MLSLKCPYCGGSLYFEKDHPMSFCPYCGSHLPDMTQYVQKAVDFEFVKQEHAMHMESEDKAIRKTKVAGTFNNISAIIKLIMLIVITLPFILLIIKLLML